MRCFTTSDLVAELEKRNVLRRGAVLLSRSKGPGAPPIAFIEREATARIAEFLMRENMVKNVPHEHPNPNIEAFVFSFIVLDPEIIP